MFLAVAFSVLLATRTRRLESLNRELTEQIERRKKAEQDAEVFSSHNKLLLEAAWDGIAGINRTGRTTFFNPAAEAITGWSEEEMLGKSQHDILHGKHADGTPYPVEKSPIMATLRDGKVHHATNEVFWHKNGRPIPVEFTSSPLIVTNEEDDEQKKQVGAVVIFRNISERRKTEAALQELSSLIASAADAIIGCKSDGTITVWNRAATKLYGYTESEMVSQYMDRLLPHNTQDEFPALIEKLKKEEAVDSYLTRRRRKDGKAISVVMSLALMKDNDGRVTGVSITSREAQPPKKEAV